MRSAVVLTGPYEIHSASAIIDSAATSTIIPNRRKMIGLVIDGMRTALVLRSFIFTIS